MSKVDQHDAIQGKIVHEYDGILEADNQLPRWWVGLYVASIIFAGFYWFAYESWGVATYQVVSYRQEMAEAAAAGNVAVSDELLNMLATDSAVVARGRSAFESNCVVCHGAHAEGNIGPNLTDAAWIHGNAAVDIHHTIHDGVGARGMPAWGPVLGEQTVQALAAFILTLRDTNVPGRAPEGATAAALTPAL